MFVWWPFVGGDRKQEGEASYRLGVAFEKNGDSDTALTVSFGDENCTCSLYRCKSLLVDAGIFYNESVIAVPDQVYGHV